MTTDKPYWEQDLVACLRVAADAIGPNSYYLRAAEYIEHIRDINAMLIRELEGIAFFAPGNGDACEIIARRAREALAALNDDDAQPNAQSSANSPGIQDESRLADNNSSDQSTT